MQRRNSACLDSHVDEARCSATEPECVYDDLDDIIAGARDGDPSDFGELFKRFNWFILEVVRIYCPNEAEDVAQQVWMVIRESLSRFDASRASFPWWLRVIARRKAISAAGRRSRYEETLHRLQSQVADGGLPSAAAPEDALADAETEKAIADCADRLKLRRHQVFSLVCNLGLSREEVSHRLGISQKRVRSILCEARAQILECLRKKGVL